MKRNLKVFFAAAGISALALMGAFLGTKENRSGVAQAALQKETAQLRIIGTTDLHGQINSKDYELGVDYNNGGLARVCDLIRKIRSEVPKENSVTLDAGDVLYDYTTEYIFAEDQNAIQPIYQAMAKIGYDAITLGNHDFDYGYQYILNQLNGTGLKNIAVVSNVTDSKTGEYPFLENKLITRKMKTESGKEAEVKIGIIGQTIPILTSKTQSYVGVLKTEDMVQNAQKEAQKLKDMGADIVIALSHTGIGPENPELNFKNVAYALTKIPEIDVVVCGHEHNLYPTTDMTSPYYKLPGVDKETYLMNGKNVIMAGDRGEAVGVADLTLEITGSDVKAAGRHSEIRRVTADNTKEDPVIASAFGPWEEQLQKYSTDVLGTLKDGETIQDYFGLLGDNPSIQLNNDAKINYALKFVNTSGTEYQKYPIIAASAYNSFGSESADNFVNIHGNITEANLTEIQPYNNYIYLYKITGRQLKEWLEWTASAYETLDGHSSWQEGTMADLMKETGLKSLIREDWLNDWSSYYVFDGVDYVIDPSKEPRYDFSGNKISNSRRIESVKYNGQEITDDMVFLLASNKITLPNEATTEVDKQIVLNGFNRGQVILKNYVKQLAAGSSLLPQANDNWSLDIPEGYEFITKAPYYADEMMKATGWYVKSLAQKEQYNYYVTSYIKSSSDKTGPHIVAAPLVTDHTASPYDVAVSVSDESGIKLLRYLSGDYGLDFEGWQAANELVQAGTFTVRKNGTYSIYAQDTNGNASVLQLVINNFNDNLLRKPVVDTYTNRKTKISGTAEPGTTIIFDAYTGTYESKVSADGTFSYSLPSQPSGSVVKVYVKDDEKKLVSESTTVTVKRTGPNMPGVDPINNNVGFIAGSLNDDDGALIALIDNKVYVPEQGGKELYENSVDIYNPDLEIVECHYEELVNGRFLLQVPSPEAGKTVTLYNLDHLSRISRPVSSKVIEVAPNAPIVYEISNIEKTLSGYIPSAGNKTYDVSLEFDDKVYDTKSSKNGAFSFRFDDQLRAGQILTVTVSDEQDGVFRTNMPKVTVKDIESYLRPNSGSLTLNQLTSKSYLISGTCYDQGTVYIAISDGEGDNFRDTLVTTDTDAFDSFLYRLDGKLEVGTTIYVMSRFTDGKIIIANKTVVLPGRPDIPVLVKAVSNADKQVLVAADKDCEVRLNIGKKVYSSKAYRFDETTKKYIYTFATDRALSGTALSVIAYNVTGTSDKCSSKVVKAAPDSPTVSAVKAGATKIKGRVEVLDPETKVYAQIGTKLYSGTVDAEGNYSIKIPKQKAGISMKIWGTNKAGRGPLIKVTVS